MQMNARNFAVLMGLAVPGAKSMGKTTPLC